MPQESLAVTVTGVVPTPNVLPVGGLAIMLTGAQPLLATAVKNTVAPFDDVATWVMFDGQLIVSGLATVTLKPQVAWLPQPSVAETVTGVVPIGKTLPLGGLAMTVTGLHPPELVTVKNTVAPLEEVAVTVMFDGQARFSEL